MAIRDRSGEPTLHQRFTAVVGPEAAWRVRLAQDFDVRTYAFDSRLESVEALELVEPSGETSALSTSLLSLADRFRSRAVAGVLLMSDGNLTDDAAGEVDWSSLGFSVYPVVTGTDQSIVDLRVDDIRVSQSDFETAPVTASFSIVSEGMDRDDLVAQVIDVASGKVVEEKELRIDRNERSKDVSFRFRPQSEAGTGTSSVRFYRAVAFRKADRELWATGEAVYEASYQNNDRWFTVERDRGPYRILYVSGRPNWEYKFLRRALETDAEVQLVGLIRIADKQPKFSFRDRGVSDTNPLFAGLGDDEEEAARQYDEAVIIRLGVRESEELSDGFPRTDEELFAYQAVIIDDIEANFFTQDQQLLLRRFVAGRGGGLLLLGGQESFDWERFSVSPLGELSPVYPPRRQTEALDDIYRFELTREGMLEPWIRLRENETLETQRLAQMPSFRSLNLAGEVKPAATVLATVRGRDQQRLPALVTQRFGRGRTAAMPLGDLWRWSLRRQPGQSDDPAQAWRQITRWLTNEVPRRVECRVESMDDIGQSVRIVVTARDERFQPLDNATVDVVVTPLGGKPFTTKAMSDSRQPGTYTMDYWARESGGYAVEATVKGDDGSEVGVADAGWTADPAAAEFRQLGFRRDWLDRIAEQSGGQCIDASELESFVASLPSRKVPVTETWVYPIWHRPWIMMLAILCLCGEWGLRRWKGLP